MRNPLGGWGSVVGNPVWSHRPVSNGNARCAWLVVPVPVMQAWCFLPVVLLARCATPDRVLGVVLIRARCVGVIVCWCGAVMPGAGERHSPAAQPAVPADHFAPEIVRFLIRLSWRACGG